jgi:hypothetical protein
MVDLITVPETDEELAVYGRPQTLTTRTASLPPLGTAPSTFRLAIRMSR